MGRACAALCLTAVFLMPGCAHQANQGVVQNTAGEGLKFQAAPKLKLAQGEKKEFSLGVTRDKLTGPVQLSFSSPPQGVSIVEKDTTIPADKNDIILTLKVAEDAPPIPETPINITATLGDLKTSSKLLLEITPSLKNKETQKEAFVKETGARLDAIKKQLDDDRTKLKDLKDDTKAKFEKQLAQLDQSWVTVKKSYDDLVASPLETWEAKKNQVANAVSSLEQTAGKFQTSLDKGSK